MKRSVSLLIILVMVLSSLSFSAGAVTTPATGYTCAQDVQYTIINGTVVNWGARGEDCTFLTTYAQEYYTGDDTYSIYCTLAGGTGIADAYTSPLYAALQATMREHHTNLQGYQDTRQYYCYTDCSNNDYSLISSFYSGKTVNSTWTGQTYNREHVWPKSKCIDQSKANDSADIMMLRATITSENSNRGNTAYGESSGYFNPADTVRGDCARMVLYGYVRWGNTSNMWGSSGVIENLEILLKWMQEDPVDTWEMARNDSVQSITGVRNVFVDYPELAWQLFGEEIPQDLVTPSGSDNSQSAACAHSHTKLENRSEATCTSDGYSGDLYCSDCGELIQAGSIIPSQGHRFLDWLTTRQPTSTTDGLKERECDICGLMQSESIPATGEPEPTVTEPPVTEPPVTEPPATEPPATEPPATEPPATEPPATEPPATEPPAAEPTETQPVETDPMQTEPSVTDPEPTAFHWWIPVVLILAAGLIVALVAMKKKK